MEQRQKVLITFLVLVLIVVGFYFGAKTITQYTGYVVSDTNKTSSFAECLGSKNVRMYGALGCSHCQDQEAEFASGDVIKGRQLLADNNVYVECDPRGENSKSEECSSAGIQGYPTWIINGEKYLGKQPLERLASLSGCSLS